MGTISEVGTTELSSGDIISFELTKWGDVEPSISATCPNVGPAFNPLEDAHTPATETRGTIDPVTLLSSYDSDDTQSFT